MLELYFSNRIELKAVVLLIDIRHSKDAKDELMMEMLHQFNIPYLLVATKADKIGTKKDTAVKKISR